MRDASSLLVSPYQPFVMFNPTEAVSALCRLSRDELYNIQGIEKLRSLLKKDTCESLKFSETILQKLEELRSFCEARDAPAIVGAKPALDFRLIDVRFVDGKSRSQSLQANIRRVMGERSLASDYVAAHPERLATASRDNNIRGKRNSATIPSYVARVFPSEVHDIASTAIRNGLKLLVLEGARLLPIEGQHGLVGIVALAHRQFERLKVQELSEELQSEALQDALKLATDLAPLFLKAIDVYSAQGEGPQAPQEQDSNSRGDSIHLQTASEVVLNKAQERSNSRKRGRHDTYCLTTSKVLKPSMTGHNTKTTCTDLGTSKEKLVETPSMHSSKPHRQVLGNFADTNHNTWPSIHRMSSHNQHVHQSSYAQERTQSVQGNNSMTAPITEVNPICANKPDQAAVREMDAETYQQKPQAFDSASLQDEQLPSLLRSGHWTPGLCSQDASSFAGCNESMALLPVFDVALDPSTYPVSTLNFDMNSINDILPLYDLDTVPSSLRYQFSSFASLQS